MIKIYKNKWKSINDSHLTYFCTGRPSLRERHGTDAISEQIRQKPVSRVSVRSPNSTICDRWSLLSPVFVGTMQTRILFWTGYEIQKRKVIQSTNIVIFWNTLRIFFFSSKRQWGTCKQMKSCSSDDSSLFWPKDGKCYQRYGRGPCPKGQLLTVEKNGKIPVCKCDDQEMENYR